MCIVCTNDCPLTSLKQFFNFTQQKSVKHINISCKVTFGFKYIYKNLYRYKGNKIVFLNITGEYNIICKENILYEILFCGPYGFHCNYWIRR